MRKGEANGNLIILCRREEQDQYYRTINLTSTLDKNLSLKAKAVHIYLMTRPNGWKITLSSFESMTKDGQTSIRSALTDLVKNRYLCRMVVKDKSHRIRCWIYLCFIRPCEMDLEGIRASTEENLSGLDFPDLENLNLGFPSLESKVYSNNNSSNKNKENISLKRNIDLGSADAEPGSPPASPSASQSCGGGKSCKLRRRTNRSLLNNDAEHIPIEQSNERTNSNEHDSPIGHSPTDNDPIDNNPTNNDPIDSNPTNCNSTKSNELIENDNSNRSNPIKKKPSTHKPIEKEDKINYLETYPREDVKSIFRYWCQKSPPLVKHSPTSKTCLKALEAVNWALNSGTSEHDIRRAIDNYAYLLDTNTKVRTAAAAKRLGWRVGLDEFFAYSDFTIEFAKKRKVKLPVESWFIECLNDREELMDRYGGLVEDQVPAYTKRIRKFWKKIMKKEVIGPDEENAFRKAAVKLDEFRRKKGLAGDKTFNLTQADDMVRLLFEALEKDVRGNWARVTPGWLYSKKTFENRLPAYLIDLGYDYYGAYNDVDSVY